MSQIGQFALVTAFYISGSGKWAVFIYSRNSVLPEVLGVLLWIPFICLAEVEESRGKERSFIRERFSKRFSEAIIGSIVYYFTNIP